MGQGMINSDGRVALDRDKLKAHRRKLGLSQEQMAFQCAEQGLYVSIASLKRAEAQKRVLYRTARDISEFFGVSLESILLQPEKLISPSVGRSAGTIDVYRAVVLTNILYEDGVSELNIDAYSEVSTILHEYRLDVVSNTKSGLILSSKTSYSDGNEPLRACYGAKQLLTVLPALIGRRCAAVITGQNTPFSEDEYALTQLGVCASTFFNNGGSAIYIGEELRSIVARYIHCQEWDNAPSELSTCFSRLVFECSSEVQQLALAGRQLELYQFRSIIDSTKNYQAAQVFCLNGVAGIGKTRLLKECVHIAGGEGYVCAELTALDLRGIHNAKLISQVVRKLLELDSATLSIDAPEMGSCRRLLTDHENRLLRALEKEDLDEEIQLSFGLMSHHEIVEQQIQLCVKLTRHVCQRSPVLLCFEDLHWADQSALDFLAQWIPLIKDQAIVILCTHRPEEYIIDAMNHLALSAPLSTVNLAPLSLQDAQFIAQQITNKYDYQHLCISKAQGNPLFLEQLLRTEFTDNQQLPYTIQTLITAKLDQLKAEDRLAVLAASAVGQKFPLDIIRFLTGDDQYQPTELIKSFLISSAAGGYSFNHALICDGIYQSIQEDAKHDLNLRCAQWYADKDTTLELRYLFRIKSKSIASKLPTAVDKLIKNFRFDLALEFINSALEDGVEGLDNFQTLYTKADIHNKLGQFKLAAELAEKALAYAASPADKVEALLLNANALNTLDRFDSALVSLVQAEEIANQFSMPSKLARIYYLKGNFFFPKGDIDVCSHNHKQALEYAKQARDLEMQARALGGLCDAAYAGGKMYSAYGYVRECLEISENHDFKTVIASNLFMLGTVRIYQNQSKQALRDTLNGIELTRLVGHSRAEIVSRLTAAWVYLDMLELSEAKYQIHAAISLAKNVGAKRFIPFLQESLARAEYLEGNYDAAAAVIEEAIPQVEILSAQQFIGPWVYATAALVGNNKEVTKSYLAKGDELLADGCIGHNYFRFYVLAMESCIRWQMWAELDYYKQQLIDYTREEPTPWSQYYIQRATLILKSQTEDVSQGDVRSLILQAQEAGLLSSVNALSALLESKLEQ